MIDCDKIKDDYESGTDDLLQWTRAKSDELNERNLPNTIEGTQQEMSNFHDYRIKEKPSR